MLSIWFYRRVGDVMIKAYFAIELACYLIVALIVVMLVAAGIVAILMDKFKK